MLVVLGLDSLDAQRVNEHETPTIDAFAEQSLMETPDGLEPNELITGYLWPSMLLGEHPADAFPGQYQATESEETSLTRWNNPILDSAPARSLERLLVDRLPREWKNRIKSVLSNINVEQERHAATVLDQRESLLDAAENPRLISVPGINPDSSNTELKSMVADSTAGSKRPKQDAESFERAAVRGDSDRLIRTLEAIRSREHDLLFAHFYSLDLIQHVWVGSENKMARWHYLYDGFVSQVLQEATEDDTVVIVSDHGMQSNGVHSKRAFYAATKVMWEDHPVRMIDLRQTLEKELSNHDIEEGRTQREMEISNETEEHLKNLGYFDS